MPNGNPVAERAPPGISQPDALEQLPVRCAGADRVHGRIEFFHTQRPELLCLGRALQRRQRVGRVAEPEIGQRAIRLVTPRGGTRIEFPERLAGKLGVARLRQYIGSSPHGFRQTEGKRVRLLAAVLREVCVYR